VSRIVATNVTSLAGLSRWSKPARAETKRWLEVERVTFTYFELWTVSKICVKCFTSSICQYIRFWKKRNV